MLGDTTNRLSDSLATMAMSSALPRFRLTLDNAAEAWLEQHSEVSRLYIALESTRCCYGGVFDVQIRSGVAPTHRGTRNAHWLLLGDVRGCQVFLDARLSDRMPGQVPLTARGVGPFRHLQLELSGEQWGELLYSTSG